MIIATVREAGKHQGFGILSPSVIGGIIAGVRQLYAEILLGIQAILGMQYRQVLTYYTSVFDYVGWEKKSKRSHQIIRLIIITKIKAVYRTVRSYKRGYDMIER